MNDPVTLGGTVVVALALVRVIEMVIIKLLNGKGGVSPTLDSFASEVAWRTRVESILKGQGKILDRLTTLLEQHEIQTKEAMEELREIRRRLDRRKTPREDGE